MKIIKCLNTIIIFGTFFFTSTAFSYEVGGARKFCQKPKFSKFSPPERVKNQSFQEVEPGSEISFIVWGSVDPEYIKVFVKKQLLKPTIINKNSFFKVSAMLPAELNGTFARIDLIAKAEKEECTGKDGWLIKIKKTTETTEVAEPVTKEPVPTEQSISTEQ